MFLGKMVFVYISNYRMKRINYWSFLAITVADQMLTYSLCVEWMSGLESFLLTLPAE